MIDARIVWRACIVAVLAGMIGLAITWAAGAHSWYPAWCCSDKDCMPVPPEAVRVTPEGYVIAKTGELLPWKDPRIRYTPAEHEDGRGYHWCRRLKDIPATVYSRAYRKDETICLFVPQGGA